MVPLRLVLDTNIVISAVLKPDGLQRTVILLALSKPTRWYVSEPILWEYDWVMSRPSLQIPSGTCRRMMQRIRNGTHLVAPKYRLHVAADPDDDKFLECADAAHADYLVTGNLRHFPEFWKILKVISSRELVSIAAPHLLR